MSRTISRLPFSPIRWFHRNNTNTVRKSNQWKDYDENLCVEAWPMMGIVSRSDVGTSCYYDNPWRQIYYTSVSLRQKLFKSSPLSKTKFNFALPLNIISNSFKSSWKEGLKYFLTVTFMLT
jgi:hypothetical protein